MANYMTAFDLVIGHEGKYSNHPSDSGGETMFGITVETARGWGYKGKMKEMPLSVARAIMKEKYWDELNLDNIDNQIFAEIGFDMAVNMGEGTGARYLQKAYNFTTRKNIKVDGDIGEITTGVINGMKTKRDKELFVLVLNAIADKHYLECCEKKEKNEDFLLGWLRRADSYVRRLA